MAPMSGLIEEEKGKLRKALAAVEEPPVTVRERARSRSRPLSAAAGNVDRPLRSCRARLCSSPSPFQLAASRSVGLPELPQM